MTQEKSTGRNRPAQVAERKRKPLGQENLPVGKKSKLTKTGTDEQESPSELAIDDRQQPKLLVSPQRHVKATEETDDEEESRVFVSPQKYLDIITNTYDGRPRPREKASGERQRAEVRDRLLNDANSPESISERILKSAQDTLMIMTENRAGNQIIENQSNIIGKLAARIRVVDQPSESRLLLRNELFS
jgi:hypothetical protein